jgi:hypothetical protein
MLRFTIRELMLLTLIVALALGWILREVQLAAEVLDARHDAARWGDEAGYWKAAAERLINAATKGRGEAEWHHNGVWVRMPGIEPTFYYFDPNLETEPAFLHSN